MQFLVSTAAKALGIVNPVVCMYRNVAFKKEAKEYDQMTQDLMQRIMQIRSEVIPTDAVQGFRELYSKVHSSVLPAGEKLVAAIEKRQSFPRYGNLIDAYNLVACEKATCIGAHDGSLLEREEATLIFRTAHGDEKIVPSFKKKAVALHKGDYTYGVMNDEAFDPFAWFGRDDVDSNAHKLTERTTSMLLAVTGHASTTRQDNIAICQKVFDNIKLSCPDATMEIIEPQFFEDEIPQ